MILAPSILSCRLRAAWPRRSPPPSAAARGARPRRRDGRPLRPQHHARPAGREGRSARPRALPLDVHLMIENADRYLDAFVDAGATWISLHVEALPAPAAHGRAPARAGRARRAWRSTRRRRSATLDEILPELDYVLVMSVNPGLRRPEVPARQPRQDPPPARAASQDARPHGADRGGRRRGPRQRPRAGRGGRGDPGRRLRGVRPRATRRRRRAG